MINVRTLEQRHVRHDRTPEGKLPPHCDADGQAWPCDAAVLLKAHRAQVGGAGVPPKAPAATAAPAADAGARALLLWQVAGLVRDLAWLRQWWATMQPDIYGPWSEGQA